jgi:hypothetical protein
MTPEEWQLVAHERREKEQAQYDAVVNAIAAAGSDAENAQKDLERAWATGDTYGAAEHQRRLSRAEARLVQLENGKDAWDARDQQVPNYPEQQPVQQASPEQIINSLQGLIPEEKAWLHRHPELVRDQSRVEELKGTFAASQRMGLVRGTPEYFQFFDQRLGLDAGSAAGLTPAQMDAAKISGVTPDVYAENLRKMRQIDARFGPRYAG